MRSCVQTIGTAIRKVPSGLGVRIVVIVLVIGFTLALFARGLDATAIIGVLSAVAMLLETGRRFLGSPDTSRTTPIGETP
ncbi:hypothetical protein SAMN05443668_13619 [Cryptosporangium aurantiacum]|uniref:Uncharacterized protein n=1 Tax=Cryptosporangium aurantiacum TaxID=134849 RepID=A0A1M7RPW3_9ACTN|nr:hypothetical protein SAMN05443668_13619 [Cryptosporangium aurantiacum]